MALCAYMAECAPCVFYEMDKRMENAWFLANYNEAKTMHLSFSWKTHRAHLAMYLIILSAIPKLVSLLFVYILGLGARFMCVCI